MSVHMFIVCFEINPVWTQVPLTEKVYMLPYIHTSKLVKIQSSTTYTYPSIWVNDDLAIATMADFRSDYDLQCKERGKGIIKCS